MIKKLLIWMIPLIALVAGTATGSLMAPEKPAAESDTESHSDAEGGKVAGLAEAEKDDHGGDNASAHDGTAAWFSFPNQFFVPIVRRGEVDRIMVLTLTIETSEAAKPGIEAQEHRLRDALLRSLIVHANTGGFSGNYTADAKLEKLRASLKAAAVRVAGADAHDVLIEDLALTDG
ncbi:flagellar basal body-associated FliL family protein [Paracoccus tegillarcae]|uniref:flagellar basal body-associated FliL family protein n=1 Tax=Paracoccus tegillarcae TaxID=1529068 RepID=UPI001300928F|nr:hypothetical protein [Paracoccus tegillarcae]